MSEAIVCSEFVLKHFPKPCVVRKDQSCTICGGAIRRGERCCRWTGLVRGNGWETCHAHAECYAMTERWSQMDWERHLPFDCERPVVRMIWP